MTSQSRPFDTIRDLLRSLSLVQSLLKDRNSPYPATAGTEGLSNVASLDLRTILYLSTFKLHGDLGARGKIVRLLAALVPELGIVSVSTGSPEIQAAREASKNRDHASFLPALVSFRDILTNGNGMRGILASYYNL